MHGHSFQYPFPSESISLKQQSAFYFRSKDSVVYCKKRCPYSFRNSFLQEQYFQWKYTVLQTTLSVFFNSSFQIFQVAVSILFQQQYPVSISRRLHSCWQQYPYSFSISVQFLLVAVSLFFPLLFIRRILIFTVVHSIHILEAAYIL